MHNPSTILNMLANVGVYRAISCTKHLHIKKMLNLKCFLLCCPLFKDLVHAEEVVGHKLLDLERQKSQILQEIEMMEQEVQRSLSKSQILDSEQEYPSQDLNQNLLSVEPLRGHIYLHYCRCQVTKMHCKFDTQRFSRC